MRLLHKKTKQVVWINDADQLPYIIISHKWYGAETTLQEFEQQRALPPDQWSAGVAKVMRSCVQADSYTEDYIWIDTCCIDKTSSAELQEAINSMFAWYRQAACCLVYFDDVTTKDDLASSLWFTRGWTLQELLAPRSIAFYNSQWESLGTRDELSQEMAAITSIPAACFGNHAAILETTVADRMSWLSTRRTSRIEDMAYCMLGIFDVHISMLYGEGLKAFKRLQEQIMHEIDDETLFLWLPDDEHEADTVPLLAPHPRCFKACRGHDLKLDHYFIRDPTRSTRRGVEVQVCSRRKDQFGQQTSILLNCLVDGSRPVIPLRACPTSDDIEHNQWERLALREWQLRSKDGHVVPRTPFEQFTAQRFNLMSQIAGAPNKSVQQQLFLFQDEVVTYKIFVL